MENICEMLTRLMNGEISYVTAAGLMEDKQVTGKISDSGILKRLISAADLSGDRERFWSAVIEYTDTGCIDDECFEYFYGHDIILCSLAHLDLPDRYLKKLSGEYEEAYMTLAKRFYSDDKYSLADFVKLMRGCRNEAVIEQVFFIQRGITAKGMALYETVQASPYLDDEIKKLSRRIYEAGLLMCTDNEKLIEEFFVRNDYVYNIALSRNVRTPDSILERLAEASGMKYSKQIRIFSRETLKAKKLLNC